MTRTRVLRVVLSAVASILLVWVMSPGGPAWVLFGVVAAAVGSIGAVWARERGEQASDQWSWLPRGAQLALVALLLLTAVVVQSVAGAEAPVVGGAWTIALPMAAFVYLDLWLAAWQRLMGARRP